MSFLLVSKITVLLSLHLLPQTQMWTKYYGGINNEDSYRLALTDDGGYII